MRRVQPVAVKVTLDAAPVPSACMQPECWRKASIEANALWASYRHNDASEVLRAIPKDVQDRALPFLLVCT